MVHINALFLKLISLCLRSWTEANPTGETLSYLFVVSNLASPELS